MTFLYAFYTTNLSGRTKYFLTSIRLADTERP